MLRRIVVLVALLWLLPPAVTAAATTKLDAALAVRAAAPRGTSRVIVTTVDGRLVDDIVRQAGGTAGRRLPGLRGQVALVPDLALATLAAHPSVETVALDRPVAGTLQRTGATVGSPWIREALGFDGRGVGIAIIDSGVTNWHDDLADERIAHFADFVTNLPVAHDGYGHGTHVAGIIAGSGYDSGGTRRGIAPGATLVVLKVLDSSGDGHVSDVIAAIDYAIEQRDRFNIRVINLSVAAGVYQSYETDPLTLAARRATDAGIVVVTAAGNHGRTARGQPQHGGVTSPGNAPWVLTVGASNHQRTGSRADDTVAPFSSRGPTRIDRAMKPDVVAPGVAIESLADAGSTISVRNPEARIAGTIETAAPPYVSLTGTSMAAPVVTGTVALMLQANPSLTPNLVKAILQYTAESRPRIDIAAQGAGFINARGAVQLAAVLGGHIERADDPTPWSRQILWGNQRVRGGTIEAEGTAWRSGTRWGAAATASGEPVVWGRMAGTGEPWSGGGDEGELDLESYALEPADELWAGDDPALAVAASVPDAGPADALAWPAILPADRRRPGSKRPATRGTHRR